MNSTLPDEAIRMLVANNYEVVKGAHGGMAIIRRDPPPMVRHETPEREEEDPERWDGMS